jgi:integrase
VEGAGRLRQVTNGIFAMSVIKRGNSRNWYIQFQLNGRTYIKSARTTDKRSAEQMEREWRRELHSQTYLGRKERITIEKALELFRASKAGTPNYGNLLANSRYLNRTFRTQRYLDDLTSEDLEKLKQQRLKAGNSAGTLKHTLNLIRGAWKHARRLGYQVSELEFPEVKLPKYRLRYLSVDEEKRLLLELSPRREASGLKPYAQRSALMKRQMQDNYDLVVMLLDTGARYAEIAGLKWRSIDLQLGVINLWRPKVANESVIYMTDRVQRIMARRYRKKTSESVFVARGGNQRGYVSASIRKAFRRAGLADCSMHTLRHTHASRLIQNGMSIYEVKEVLGHADIKTTMRYAHLERKDVTSRARDVIERLNQQVEKPTLKIVP